MKEINRYYKGFKENNSRIDYIKYELLNEFGYNIDCSSKEVYNEDNIIKKSCNIKKNN